MRKRRKHKPVLILNPALGGAGYTNLRRARHFVRRGIAVFVSGYSCAALFFTQQEAQNKLAWQRDRAEVRRSPSDLLARMVADRKFIRREQFMECDEYGPVAVRTGRWTWQHKRVY